MKRIILSLLFIVSIKAVNAQFAENNSIYFSNEINIGNYLGVDFNINYIYKEKYSFKIGYSGNIRKPKSQPDDYSSGLIGVFLFSLSNPYDQLQNYQIAAGKIYKLNPKGTIRANITLGLGYSIIKEPSNWVKIGGGALGENYSWEYNTYNTVSLIINPKLEFPFTRIYGFTLSPMIQINNRNIYFGVGVGSMVGLLRKKNRQNVK